MRGLRPKGGPSFDTGNNKFADVLMMWRDTGLRLEAIKRCSERTVAA